MKNYELTADMEAHKKAEDFIRIRVIHYEKLTLLGTKKTFESRRRNDREATLHLDRLTMI